MKGIKTSKTLQVGDIIGVKTGGTVFSYAGETGETEADTAYAGDVLGEVTKISGSSIIFTDLGGRVRNTVSTGSIDFAANPDFDYSAVVEKDNTTTLQKWLSFGLGVYDKIFNKTSTTTGATEGDTGGTDNGTDNTSPSTDEKTYFQKYGIFIIIGVAVTALILILKGGKKDQRPVQYQQASAQNLPQNQPQNQYQSVRL